MTNLVLSSENSYLLPFEEGTWKLTLATLNVHSEYRRPSSPCLYVGRRVIIYQNEILTLGVAIERDGKEEKVYLSVISSSVLVIKNLTFFNKRLTTPPSSKN